MSYPLPSRIPLNQIDPGKNPRRFFDPKKMAELEASIKANGIAQPILVRPLASGRFEIIAGERRVRAATKVFPPDELIPALVREVSDEEAARLALVENTDREGMMPVEEAEAADKIVSECNGDLAEAASRLGWSPLKLRKRLSLMHCAKVVRAALEDRLITLGHAELLAAAPQAKQETALPLVVQHQMTVEQLKAELMRKARKLDEAVFDRTECAACPHNSTVQADLFSTTVGNDNCTNAPCYQAKTEAHVAVMADALRETYPMVVMLKIDEKPVMTPLFVGGPAGVGQKQAEACKTCESYGATISVLPGSEGKVVEPICFNLACNTQKVKAAFAPPPTCAAYPKSPNAPATQPLVPPTSGESTAAPAPKTEEADGPRFDPKSLRNGLMEYRRQRWNEALIKIALTYSPGEIRRLLVLLILSGEANHINAQFYRDAMAQKAKKAGFETGLVGKCGADAIAAAKNFVLASDEAAIDKFVGGIVACAAERSTQDTLTALLRASGATIAQYWKPDAVFWSLLTKSEIDALGSEIGLAAHFGDKWKPLLGKKKAEIEAAIATTDFDFFGRVPAFMAWS
ncbi:MAG: PRTRC system ParB family protein [Betaproteobacteria bacterium]